MKIKHQIFFSVLLASAFVAVSTFLIQEVLFWQNYSSIVKTVNQERVANLAALLKERYLKDGNWEAVRTDAALRDRLLLASHEAIPQPKAATLWGAQITNPIPYGANAHEFNRNIALLDAAKKPVFGPAGEVADFMPITGKGATIGYLGLRPARALFDPRPGTNARKQQFTIALIALAAFMVSAAFSFTLAKRLIIPLRKVTAALHELASGNLATRVTIPNKGEMGQLAQDFNLLALSLEKSSDARRQYTADISHELRTPLTVLRVELEALLEGVRESSPEALASLYGEILQLDSLVDDVYQLSLTDIGAMTYRKEMCSTAEILQQAVDGFRNNFSMKGVQLLLAIEGSANSLIHGDRIRFRQLFDNLLKNSLKYTNRGGRLEIRMSQQGNLVRADFEDTPPGVADAELDLLFDRFYRVEKSRNRVFGGAGLGLTICRNIVEAHDGAVSAFHSRLGGVGIRIELPVMGRTS